MTMFVHSVANKFPGLVWDKYTPKRLYTDTSYITHMDQPDNEAIILKYISSHKSSLSSDIFNGINKRGRPITINTIRKFLRKLVRNRKVVRTGVHAFRYSLKK